MVGYRMAPPSLLPTIRVDHFLARVLPKKWADDPSIELPTQIAQWWMTREEEWEELSRLVESISFKGEGALQSKAREWLLVAVPGARLLEREATKSQRESEKFKRVVEHSKKIDQWLLDYPQLSTPNACLAVPRLASWFGHDTPLTWAGTLMGRPSLFAKSQHPLKDIKRQVKNALEWEDYASAHNLCYGCSDENTKQQMEALLWAYLISHSEAKPLPDSSPPNEWWDLALRNDKQPQGYALCQLLVRENPSLRETLESAMMRSPLIEKNEPMWPLSLDNMDRMWEGRDKVSRPPSGVIIDAWLCELKNTSPSPHEQHALIQRLALINKMHLPQPPFLHEEWKVAAQASWDETIPSFSLIKALPALWKQHLKDHVGGGLGRVVTLTLLALKNTQASNGQAISLECLKTLSILGDEEAPLLNSLAHAKRLVTEVDNRSSLEGYVSACLNWPIWKLLLDRQGGADPLRGALSSKQKKMVGQLETAIEGGQVADFTPEVALFLANLYKKDPCAPGWLIAILQENALQGTPEVAISSRRGRL